MILKKGLIRFKNQNETKKDIKSINTLISLNKARESMRNTVGLKLDSDPNEAIKRYWLMNEYLSQGKVEKNNINNNIKKKKKEIIKLQTNLKGLNTLIIKFKENRLDYYFYKKKTKII